MEKWNVEIDWFVVRDILILTVRKTILLYIWQDIDYCAPCQCLKYFSIFFQKLYFVVFLKFFKLLEYFWAEIRIRIFFTLYGIQVAYVGKVITVAYIVSK